MNFLFELISEIYTPWEPSKEVSYIGDHIAVNLPQWITELSVERTPGDRDYYRVPAAVTLTAEEHPLEVTGAKYSKTLQIPVEWKDDYHVAVDTENHVVILYPAWISGDGEDDGNPGNT